MNEQVYAALVNNIDATVGKHISMDANRQAVLEKRIVLREQSQQIGVCNIFISELVDTFYQRKRLHSELESVFASKIAEEEWDDHLAKLKSFWSSVALSTEEYSGQPVP